jgi:CelD/BcsL family acetyltransferase involved in cellulose biosynthesis
VPLRAGGPPAARIVSSLDHTGLDEQTWNALAACGTNSVFQTHQWARSWWTVYGARYEPLFVVSGTAGRTTGLAPLVVDTSTARGRVVRFLGDGRADYCDLLAADSPHAVAALLGAIRDYGHWDVLDLGNLPDSSPTVALVIAAARGLGLHVLADEQFVCPTLVIRGHEPAAIRLANKPSLRRRRNYFERRGRVECRDLTTAADIEPLLDRFFAQHKARWQGTATPSLFHEPASEAFYREMTARLDTTGWLLFTIVELDGQPIATHYGFDFNDTQIWYKPAFDPAFAAGSPGVVLVQHLIQRAVAVGRKEFDFTIGDELFKWRFTNHVRKTMRLQVFRDPARYVFERSKRGVMTAVRRAAARVRQM